MKLLIVCSNGNEARQLISWLQSGTGFISAIQPLFRNTPERLVSFVHHGIEIDLVIVGNTMLDTAFHLGMILSLKKYHLVLQCGLCSAYDHTLHIGELLSVINDKPGDIGIANEHEFLDAYQSKFFDINAYPHNRSGFINLTNAYFNVFLDIKKVAAISVNQMNGGLDLMMSRKKRFNIHIETTNGLGCTYACLYLKQPYYQLRVVSRTIHNHESDEEKSIDILSTQVISLIEKLA